MISIGCQTSFVISVRGLVINGKSSTTRILSLPDKEIRTQKHVQWQCSGDNGHEVRPFLPFDPPSPDYGSAIQ